MLAVKHFDPVMGVDIHIVTIPPAGPVPMPHPHISLILDPMDYVPILGATVLVGGIPRGTAGTAGKPVPHIPMGGPFVKPPGNEDEIFMGSATVLAEDTPFTFTALPVLGCQDVGMPAPPRAKKPRKSYGMLLPTSTVISVPAGMPVLIGGPPTIDMMGMAMAAGMAGLGKAAKKLRGVMKKSKKMKKISKAIHKKAKKAMDKLGVPPNVRNKVHKGICTVTGHPVDVATGKMFTDHIDFELPGPIPLVWERTWYSTSTYEGPLGHGWHHSYDMCLSEVENAVALRLADGRPCAFPKLKVGEESFNRAERITLIRDEYGYAADSVDGLRYRFTPHNADHTRQLLREIIDKPSRAKIRFAYDEHAFLIRIKDSGNRIVTIKNDENGRIRQIFMQHPEKENSFFCNTEYEYRHDDLVSVTDSLSNKMLYRYDAHLMIKETNRNGLSFYFEYDGRNQDARCIRTWGDGGLYDHRLHYDLVAKKTTVTNSLMQNTLYVHNGILPVEILDARNAKTTISYNEHNQIICESCGEEGDTVYEYDARGNQTSVTNPDGSQIDIKYDDNDRAIFLSDSVDGEWHWAFDEDGRLCSSIDSLDREIRYFYEGVNLVKVIDTSGHETHFGYDDNYNLCAFKGPEDDFSYAKHDKLGRVIESIDPAKNSRKFEYDIANRVVKVHEPDGNDRTFLYDSEHNVLNVRDKQFDVSFSYCGVNRLASRSQTGLNVTFEYDTEEQLIAITNENGKRYKFELDSCGDVASTIAYDGSEKRFVRDKYGKVVRAELPGQHVINYAYDAMKRVCQVDYSEGSQTRYVYRPDGELLEAENEHTKLVFTLDKLGNVLKEEQDEFWVSSDYDSRGFRTQLCSSFGEAYKFERNSYGEWRKISANDGDYTATVSRDILGLEISRDLPGGVSSRWQRDKTGRPINQRVAAGNTTQIDRNYEWDCNLQLKKISSNNNVINFEFDKAGNLVGARKNDGKMDLRVPDAIGNLFRTYEKNDCEYGESGELLSTKDKHQASTRQYDELGNLVKKITSDGKSWRYEWSESGHLTGVVRPDGLKITFAYDPLGRRIRKKVGTKITRWIWDGNNPLHEWVEYENASGTSLHQCDSSQAVNDATQAAEPALQQKQAQGPPIVHEGNIDSPITWIFEPDSMVPIAKKVGNQHYSFICDHLGTPISAYSQSGELVWSQSLDIWGRATQQSAIENFCAFRWPGQYEDAETGLSYNRYRYYDPDAGGYISQDPIELWGGINFYKYVSNPTTWFDPFGLTKAPASLPNEPGVYILTNGNDCYVGSSGIGAQGMNQRVSDTDHKKAQKLLDKPGTKVQYVRVDMGTATSRSDRNNILRFYESREYEKSKNRGLNMLNGDSVQSAKGRTKSQALISQHGASGRSRRTTCK